MRLGAWALGRLGASQENGTKCGIRVMSPGSRSLSWRMIPYERFDAWKAAHAFTLAIYRHTKGWPADERYGLTAQVRRAAHSVSANIVEGQARRGKKEFRRFLDIAWGSLAEVGYSVRLAKDLEILDQRQFDELETLRAAVGRPLFGLIRSMGQADPKGEGRPDQ